MRGKRTVSGLPDGIAGRRSGPWAWCVCHAASGSGPEQDRGARFFGGGHMVAA